MQINALNFLNSFGAQGSLNDGMVERHIKINNEKGIHSRPAANITRLTMLEPDADVFISSVDNKAAKSNITGSVLSLLILALRKDTEAILSVPETYPDDLQEALIQTFEADNEDIMTNIVDEYCATHSNN